MSVGTIRGRLRQSSRWTTWGVVLALICCLLACGTADNERTEFILGILRERAKHLHRSDQEEIARELIHAERRTGVDALLLLALVEEESHCEVEATGPRGGLGLLQVLPATARDVTMRNRIAWNGPASLFNPSVNLRIGATYLAELHARFGSWDLALTAYNRGPTAATRIARKTDVRPPVSPAACFAAWSPCARWCRTPESRGSPPKSGPVFPILSGVRA